MAAHVGTSPGVSFILMAVLMGVLSAVGAGPPAVDCRSLSPWTSFPNPPEVNQVHVFCGEWHKNTPRGFHSRPDGINPPTVGQFTVSQRPNAQGIYGGQWTYHGHPQPEKFSTMFPDTCAMHTVLNSIIHAFRHQTPCPANAPAWAVCGPNRPRSVPSGAGPFCDASDGTVFTIAMGLFANQRINTAFPLR
jgi:hypothetical protein